MNAQQITVPKELAPDAAVDSTLELTIVGEDGDNWVAEVKESESADEENAEEGAGEAKLPPAVSAVMDKE